MQFGRAGAEGIEQRCWYCCVDNGHDVYIMKDEFQVFVGDECEKRFAQGMVFNVIVMATWFMM